MFLQGSGSQPTMFAPGDIGQCQKECCLSQPSAIRIWRVETRDAAKHPPVLRMALHNKELSDCGETLL